MTFEEIRKSIRKKYNDEGGTFKIDGSEKENCTIFQNNENQLIIEFYDIVSAKARIDTSFYYPAM